MESKELPTELSGTPPLLNCTSNKNKYMGCNWFQDNVTMINCRQPKIIQQEGRCYIKVTCKTCGCSWHIDSSD